MIATHHVKLIALNDHGEAISVGLSPNRAVLVGKSCNCGLQLVGDEISDIHCSICLESGRVWVQDWLSASGTRLNGKEIASRVEVHRDATVQVGCFSIRIAEESSAADTNPANAMQSYSPTQTSLESHDPSKCSQVLTKERCSDLEIPSEANASDLCEQHEGAESDCDAFSFDIDSLSLDSEDRLFSDDAHAPDHETISLLQAEIADLQAALAQRDAEESLGFAPLGCSGIDPVESEHALRRMQELVEEANRADERVMILEEMLHAAEDANRAEVEERAHLEAWVSDIERRIGQREQEHAAELGALRERHEASDQRLVQLQRQLRQAAMTGDSAQKRYEQSMEQLQHDNQHLQQQLADTNKELRQYQQKCENLSLETDVALREERAKVAKEHAEMSRLKYEYAQKISELEQAIPKSESALDPRIQSLQEHRQHLREMSEERKRSREQQSLSGRLKRIWNQVRD